MAAEDEAPRKVQQSVFAPWPSRNFKRLVEGKDVEAGETEECLRTFDDDQVNEHVEALEKLELDSAERQQKLCTVYSLASGVYSEMNRAIREDDKEAIGRLAPYIKELRDVFLTDHHNQVITPFEGTVWRGVGFEDPEKALEDYQRDAVFSWPAFSSTSLDSGVADNFSGSGLVFEIRCYPPAGTYDDDDPEFAPASISAWSVFGDSEQEVLFPPNVKFRVVNVKKPTEENGLGAAVVQCETVAFESVWSMVRNNDVEGVKRWCKDNPGRVNTEDCEHHLLDELEDDDEDDDSDEESDEDDSDDDCPWRERKPRKKDIKILNPNSMAGVLKSSGARHSPEGRRRQRGSGCEAICAVS